MELTKYERETIINFNEAEDEANVYTHNRKLLHRLARLAQDRPEECKLIRTMHDGCAVEYSVPKSWLRINPPRKSVPLSDAQMQKRLDTLNRINSERKTTTTPS